MFLINFYLTNLTLMKISFLPIYETCNKKEAYGGSCKIAKITVEMLP